MIHEAGMHISVSWKKVILIEPTDWIGGQLTAQAVPPDEHPWIEGTGRTSTYDLLRKNIRNYYRCNYPLLPKARFDERLNPGYGNVSPLCHEPRVALAAMSAMLAPHLASSAAKPLFSLLDAN
jgi:hypothetical protein